MGLSKDCFSESVPELFLEEGIDFQGCGKEEAVVCWQAGQCRLGRRQRETGVRIPLSLRRGLQSLFISWEYRIGISPHFPISSTIFFILYNRIRTSVSCLKDFLR